MSNIKRFSSRKEVIEFLKEKEIDTSNWSEEKWFSLNKGQAEIHMMALAESIYDAMNESNPTQLLPGMYHIPFRKQINELYPDVENDSEDVVKISVSMAARTSYTVVGDEKEISKEKHIDLHDRLISQDPPHSSPLEHCARAMSDSGYFNFVKGNTTNAPNNSIYGWCRNFKGFIPYRHIIETQMNKK